MRFPMSPRWTSYIVPKPQIIIIIIKSERHDNVIV